MSLYPKQCIRCNASDLVNLHPLQCICSSAPVAVHLLQNTPCSVCGVEHPMCIHYSAVLSLRCIQYVPPVLCCCYFQAKLAFKCMNEFSILQCCMWMICLCYCYCHCHCHCHCYCYCCCYHYY